jgi:uncharacterized protein YjbJ (UPF0337 family)
VTKKDAKNDKVSSTSLPVACLLEATTQEDEMDKDRVEGVAKQAKGAVKDAAGKLTGDAKLQAEGKSDKLKGKLQNAAGGAKDAARK